MKNEKNEAKIPYFPMSKDKFDCLGMAMTDPLGSYTGVLKDPTELPVQDVDDL